MATVAPSIEASEASATRPRTVPLIASDCGKAWVTQLVLTTARTIANTKNRVPRKIPSRCHLEVFIPSS